MPPSDTLRPPFGPCPVCAGIAFEQRAILWPGLVAEWQLSPEEAGYIEVQQGLTCLECGANLRSMTLTAALMSVFSWSGTFAGFCRFSDSSRTRSLLELNLAGSLTPHLRNFRRYQLCEYPALDMQRMDIFPDSSWDIVVHSDTLEHIDDPLLALSECRRILAPGGLLAFTVPIIVGRLTRRRDHLPPSYHGGPANPSPDIRVVTEYGADAWRQLMEAGFRRVELFSLMYPHSIVLLAHR